jgi:opacity protein-like surface antigen
MKKQFLLILTITISTLSFAQSKFSSDPSPITFGARAGVLSSGITGDASNNLTNLLSFTNGIVTPKNSIGYYAGVFATIPVSDMIALEPGLSYAQKGYELDGELNIKGLGFLGANAKAKLQTQYIDIPVMLKINTGSIYVFAGPQFSYLSKAQLNSTAGVLGINLLNTNMDVTSQFNRWDVALSGGLGFTLTKGVSLTASYDYGLSKIDASQSTKAYNTAIKLGIGVSF